MDDIPSLPVHNGGEFTRPLRICFSVSNFLEFPERSGIGRSNAAFAGALAKAGHEVTVLFASSFSDDDPRVSGIMDEAVALGLNLVFLPELPFELHAVLNGSTHPPMAYKAWYWLKDKNFDVIHFNEYQTSGFFCVASKRAGLGFQNTLLCVLLCNPSRWLREGDDMLINEFWMMEIDFLEQRTAELADLVFVPNQYIARWVTGRGWNLPARLYHQPNLTRPPDSLSPSRGPAAGAIQEIVFYGRLQPRKGLLEFCKAIDRLKSNLPKTISITFLGSHVTGPIDCRSHLIKKSMEWRVRVNVLDSYTPEASLAYLQRPGVLAVLPSRGESLGNAIYDCLLLKIPFLAANEAAVRELIHPADHDSILFELSEDALAKKLAEALIDPPRIGLPRYLTSESEKQWVGWHNGLVDSEALRTPDNCPPVPLPRVTVCLVHFNQPVLVLKAIESLEAQTYSNFEVILVDNGSTHPETEAVLLEIEDRFAIRGWRVLRQGKLPPGAARNYAAREASGEFLMFMDDDNVAKPHEIESFVKAALTSGQDVVACVQDVFEGLGDPVPEENEGYARQIFLGGALSAGFFENTFGDTNFFIRKSVFHAVGGFSEETNASVEDWHLLARLALAGYQILMLPQSFYHYRIRPDSFYRASSPSHKEKLILSLFDHLITPPIKDILVYCFSLHKKTKLLGGDSSRLRHYRTVIDSSASELGVEASWGPGWFDDEKQQIWSGGDIPAATILLNAVSPCVIDFSARVSAAEPGNSLRITLNDDVLLSDFKEANLRLEAISLKRGINTLCFTPRLPPATGIPGDQRKLSYLFNQISIASPADNQPVKAELDLLPPLECTDRTVLINHLHRIGARAEFAEGWHDDELIHRWSGRMGQHSSLIFESPIQQRILLRADVAWVSEGNSLRAHFSGKTTLFDPTAGQIALRLTLKPGISNLLDFETKQPPASPGPDDPRLLSFRLSNIQITLES